MLTELQRITDVAVGESKKAGDDKVIPLSTSSSPTRPNILQGERSTLWTGTGSQLRSLA